jgi:DNA-binding GntR family transcriptional regulator
VTDLNHRLTGGVPANATLTTRMHEALEEAIISGQLAPGQRLHAETLAAQHGMSRIPVREALRSLHEAGWGDIKPRHGVHVRERSLDELVELFEFRAVIESQVASWAAERRSVEELEALRRVVATNGTVTDEVVDRSASAFYASLRTAAHNSVLEATSAQLEKRARFYFSTVVHDLGSDWLEVHRELLRCVEEQDSTRAADVARKHITNTGSAVKALLFPGG